MPDMPAMPAMPASPAPLEWPGQAPDVAAGRALFAERCAECHGPTGRGDGPLAARLPQPPADLSSIDIARLSSLAERFDIIVNGRIERFMPPFGGSLDVQESWDAVAGVTALAWTPDRMARAIRVWEGSCASCHAGGDDGAGTAPRLTLETVGQKNHAALRSAYAADHAAIQDLADDDLDRALDAALLLGLALPPEAATPLDGLLSGRVVNGTVGEDAVAETTVSVTPLYEGIPGETVTVTATTDGAFTVGDLPSASDIRYRLVATYAGVNYARSDIVPYKDGQPAEDLEVVVYEPDATVPIGALGVRMLVTPAPARGVLEVVERWLFINTSDRARVAEAPNGDGDSAPTIRLALPQGATGITFADPLRRAAVRIQGDLLLDTTAVPPGEHELVLVYDVPYAGSTARLVRRAIERLGEVTIVVADPVVQTLPIGLQKAEPVDLGDLVVPRVMGRMIEAETEVGIELSGLPIAAASAHAALAPAPAPLVGLTAMFALGLGAAGLAMLLAIVYAGAGARPERRLRRLEASLQRVESRLADLDARHARGELSPNEYARSRAALEESRLTLERTAADTSATSAQANRSMTDTGGPG